MMNKILYIIPLFVLSLLLVSCDDTAREEKYEVNEITLKDANISVTLCSPKYDNGLAYINNSTADILCSIDNQNHVSFTISPQTYTFNISVLDDDEQTLQIRSDFQNSPIATIFTCMKEMKEEGSITSAQWDSFIDKISYIKEVISLTEIKTSDIATKKQGASTITYDYADNSGYSAFTTSAMTITRESGLSDILSFLSSLSYNHTTATGQNMEQAISILKYSLSLKEETIDKASGWILGSYINSTLSFSMRIEQSSEIFTNISRCYFGIVNDELTPYADTWLVLEI